MCVQPVHTHTHTHEEKEHANAKEKHTSQPESGHPDETAGRSVTQPTIRFPPPPAQDLTEEKKIHTEEKHGHVFEYLFIWSHPSPLVLLL